MANKNFLIFSLLRVLAFAVPFALMTLFPIMREFWWLSAILAALIGLSLSSLFLNKRLNRIGNEMAAKRKIKEHPDAAAEDAIAGQIVREASAE